MGRVISRREWGARPPKGPYVTVDPKPRAVLHHSAGPVPKDRNHAETLVRAYQYQHMFTRQLGPNGAVDIAYHALLDGDGNVYLGRPFGSYGAHAPGGNELTGICLLGNYELQRPSSVVVQAVYDVCKAWGLRELVGHRALYPTACPGIFGMETAESLNRSLAKLQRPMERVEFPPPHGRTLRLAIRGDLTSGWRECNNKIVSIAVHPHALVSDDSAIAWRGYVWRGASDVTNVCKHLRSKFNLVYR